MTQVFISYSRKDLAFVQKLAADLQSAGLDVWWDLSGTKGGDEWETKITGALKRSQYMIVVLTPDAVESRWVRREYLLADEEGLEIIPLKYRICKSPLTLQDRQGIDALDGKYPACLSEILHALGVMLHPNPGPRPVDPQSLNPGIHRLAAQLVIGNLQFIKIPAGKFIMGSKIDNPLARDSERPQHTLELPAYYIARYPVTNRQYGEFSGKDIKIPAGEENHPVVDISWLDAQEFIAALNEKFYDELPENTRFRLPTEAQWEKAARGEYGNEWPWGNEFDEKKCNSSEGKSKAGTTPVDAYPLGESPYGVADMVGNVWEWTHSLFKEYPYKAEDGREREKDPGSRVLRGGSFHDVRRNTRCAYRLNLRPDPRYNYLGFRVCASPIS